MTSTANGPASGAREAHPDHLGHVIFITAAAAMGGFLFGYDSSVINGAVEAIRDRYDIGSGTLAQVIAVALIGCAIGAATAGRIADRIGRIRCMQISSVLFTASAIGSALPFSLLDLALWRVVGGFAIGMASVIGPAYIAEVSPPPTAAGWAPSSRRPSSSASPSRSWSTTASSRSPTETSAARSAASKPGSGCSA
ncbi:hypothetical protein Sfulv_44490 [Streptomyces fulvorobeus]|uniref:Major facilitator superfamily (MFS) profile domain-containing protein n=1 Tax=Streptomyces fulvorobeus TaxID=284028 RepID=A0A7J0CB60_9ACTN|nr:hypothetical protein Sfulv_44490 [Streptomyces fulvorobeus]